jgi:hypothetical protein
MLAGKNEVVETGRGPDRGTKTGSRSGFGWECFCTTRRLPAEALTRVPTWGAHLVIETSRFSICLRGFRED